jgi:membrane protease YdiL (CAAX protease family)
MVMVFYPFLSAWPQEFIYRKFYFRRYEPIFKSEKALIISSTLTFGFLHIMYDNPVSVILSLFGGLIFSLSYNKTRKLFFPWIEHSLYGQMIFTVGLGRFFYEPVIRPSPLTLSNLIKIIVMIV